MATLETHHWQGMPIDECVALRRGDLILLVILGVAALAVAIELWRGQPVCRYLHGAVALAVGALTEGLPAVVMVTLAIGGARMARLAQTCRWPLPCGVKLLS